MKKKGKIKGGFVVFTYEMMESPAYRELTGASLKALLLFLRKVKTHHHLDRYEQQFPLTFAEAKKKGISHSSFSRAITQLIETGFIDCAAKGGLRNEGKSYSYYRLSRRWKDFGTERFISRHRGYSENVQGREAF